MKKRSGARRAPASPRRGSRASERDSERRSGDFSKDPIFDPAELFDVIEHEESVHRVLDAMRQFVTRHDLRLLERGVAVYVRSARARNESIEKVLAGLETIADELERGGVPGFKERDTPLRGIVLRGVLLAYYGADTVRREADARTKRAEHRSRDVPAS